jgi:hypothetical protein
METPYATSLLHLSTVAAQKNSNQPWVKFQSAGWVNIQSAPTPMTLPNNALMMALIQKVGAGETAASVELFGD